MLPNNIDEEHFSSLVQRVDIDVRWLQGLQDYFCNMANMFLFLVDEEGNRITEISGDKAEIGRILAVVSGTQLERMLDRVINSKTEEQIIEFTEYSNVKIATIAVKVKGAQTVCWVAVGVINEIEDDESLLNIKSKLDNKNFNDSVDFLRVISSKVYATTFLSANAMAESVKSKSAELEMLHELRKSEFMTDVVSLLDSDESFEEICEQMVHYVGNFSDVAYAYVIRPNINGLSVDVMGGHTRAGLEPMLNRIKAADILKYLKNIGDKATVISYKTKLESEFRDWLTSVSITSAVILPVFTSKPNRQVAMYVIFADDVAGRLWDRDEIKFFTRCAICCSGW